MIKRVNEIIAEAFANDPAGACRAHTVVQKIIEDHAAEVERYRQAIWDARSVMGFDNDGAPTPAARVFPHLADDLIACAKEFRADYDAAINEAAEVEALRADAERYRWLRDPDNYPDYDFWVNVLGMCEDAESLDVAIDAARTATSQEGE